MRRSHNVPAESHSSSEADSIYKRNADQLGVEVIGMLGEVGVESIC